MTSMNPRSSASEKLASPGGLRLLAVGAHLDDVEIACGGTLARAVARGSQAKILVLSGSDYQNYDGELRRTKDAALAEGQAAAATLGVELEVLDFETKDIPHTSAAVEAIESRLDAWRPDIIFTHWPFDTHQAHRGVSLSTVSASRYFHSVLMYEPMMPAARSYAAFRPQVYVDISDYIDVKIEALKAHTTEYNKFGDRWIDAIEARSRLRGFEMSVAYAEAFEAVRMAWDL